MLRRPLLGCLVLAALIAGACGDDEPTAPDAGADAGPAQAGDSGDRDRDQGSPPAGDGGAPADGGPSDGGDGGDARASHPVVSYTVLGEISYTFAGPYALAVDSNDALYVSQRTDAEDTHTLYLTNRDYRVDIAPGQARILKFDKAGTYLGWIGQGSDDSFGLHGPSSGVTAQYSFVPGAFNMVRGMTFGENGHLFVLDDWRIQELDASFLPLRWTGHGPGIGFGWRTGGGSDTYAGPLIGGFNWPSCLRIHDGRFWVGNWYWDYPGFPNGQYNAVDVLDMTTGLGAGWLGGAYEPSTATTTHGYFDAGGTLEPRATIAHGTAPGLFSSPRHFVWHGDEIYVVDDTNDPVLSVFDEKGVQQPGVLRHLAGAGEKPFALAVDDYGNLVVSDMYTGSVRFFTSTLDANGEFTQVAEWQVDAPAVEGVSYPLISDFAWDSQHVLYVAATTKNKVYKIRLEY